MDQPSVDEIVEIASASRDLGEFRASCLRRLAPVVGCDAALMQDATPGSSFVEGGCLHIPSDSVRRISRSLSRYSQQMLPLLAKVTREHVAVDVEVLGRDHVAQMDITREEIAPLGLHAPVLLLGIPRRHPAGQMTLLAFLRTRGRTSYSQPVRQTLRKLVPALSLGNEALAAQSPETPLYALNAQERALVEWLRLGYSNAQIAAVLETSVPAVKNRLLRLFKRLEVESRTELLFRLGLVRTDTFTKSK